MGERGCWLGRGELWRSAGEGSSFHPKETKTQSQPTERGGGRGRRRDGGVLAGRRWVDGRNALEEGRKRRRNGPRRGDGAGAPGAGGRFPCFRNQDSIFLAGPLDLHWHGSVLLTTTTFCLATGAVGQGRAGEQDPVPVHHRRAPRHPPRVPDVPAGAEVPRHAHA